MAVQSNDHFRWLALTGERSARLVRCQRTTLGGNARWIADEMESLRSTWEAPFGKEMLRRESSGSSGQVEGRFAHELAQWLEKRSGELGIKRLWLFAPANMVGVLRQIWSPRLRPMLVEHVADLSEVRGADLLANAMVIELLGAAK
jgi:hypothetical protein